MKKELGCRPVPFEHPNLNAFRKGRKLVLMDDVTISVLVERELAGEKVPEPVGIQAAQRQTYRQIHEEIRAAQRHEKDGLGGLSGIRWIRFSPASSCAGSSAPRRAALTWMSRFGAVGVTAVGMFGANALWFIPLSGATVPATVGDHDIVDGAPAARFLTRLSDLLSSADALRDVEAVGR